MNIKHSVFKFSLSLKVAGILAIGLVTVLTVLPRKFNVSFADNLNCTNSTTPVFNPYEVVDNPGDCQDYAFMRARVGSQSGFTTGSIQANPGDTVQVVLYIDNGAALNSEAASGIQLNTSADLSSGNYHNISATVTASNISNSLSGSLGILTPEGSSLQVGDQTGQWFQKNDAYMGSFGNIVNTTTQLPDQQACFPYVRFIYMTFKVVGPAAQPATGTISAQAFGQHGSQCLFRDGTVTWNTSNVQSVEVTVQDTTANSVVNSMTGTGGVPNGNGDTPWLVPGDNFEFVLYNTTDGQHTELHRTTLNVPALDCGGGGGGGGQPGTGTISYSNIQQVSGQCLYSADITWSTSNNISSVLVTVDDPTKNSDNYYGNDKPFSFTNNTTSPAPWIAPGYPYRFTLWEMNPVSGGETIAFQGGSTYSVKKLYETWIPEQASLNCGGNTGQASATISATLGDKISGQCLWNGTVSWNIANVQNPVVYVIDPVTKQPSVFGRPSSTENNSYPAPWLEPGYVYIFRLSGDNISNKEATIDTTGLSCGGQTATLSCDPNYTNQPFNSVFSFFAKGGTAPYSWTTSGGNPSYGNTNDTSTAFNTQVSGSGNRVDVTVRDSAGKTASCFATVTGSQLPACIALTFNSYNSGSAVSNVNPNQNFNVSCDYGSASIDSIGAFVNGQNCNWTSFSGTKANFNCTAPASAGAYAVTCRLSAGTNSNTCAQSNPAGSITVSSPIASCPTTGNSVFLSPSSISVGDTATASAPYGWTNLNFYPSNSSVASVSGSSVRGNARGVTSISGTGSFNGAANCALTPSSINVQQPNNACVNREFRSYTSGVYVNGSKTSALNPNQSFAISCDYGVNSGYITVEGNGATACGFSGFNGTAAQFSCTAPASAGSYSASCRISNNSAADNSCADIKSAGNYTVSTPSPICPTTGNAVNLNPSSINVGDYSTASAPYGWYGGSFSSSNSSVASVSGSSVRGNSQGSASISGSGFTAPNGANNCSLTPSSINVSQNISPVQCSVNPANIDAGGSATFSATLGNNSYSWIIKNASTGAVISTSNNQNFSQIFNDAGTYTGTVTSAGTNATCTVQVRQPVCVSNISSSFSADSPVKTGSTYSAVLRWTASGNHQVKLVQINPGSVSEVVLTTNGSTGSFQAGNLQAAQTYVFKLYDATCGGIIASTQVSTPANPSTLTCAADSASYNVNNTVTFRAQGGSAPYNWIGGENPSSFTGNPYQPRFAASGNKTVSVLSSDGQNANCSVYINQPGQPALSITKEVRNLGPSAVNNYSKSTPAKQNDQVRYRIVVRNTGSAAATNVVITDSQLSQLSGYGNWLFSDTNGNQVNYSGSLSAGLQIGNLPAGGLVTITYTATVNINNGTINNTATVTGSGQSQSDSAVVVVNTPVAAVVCTATPASISAGQSTTFSATGGNNSYSWTVNGGNVTASTQPSFSSRFDTAGTYTATVNSGGNYANCTVQVTTAVCVPNSNYALNASTAVKNGTTYNTTLTWFSSGNNQIKITRINPGSTAETDVTTGSANNNVGFTVTGLQASQTYIFKMYDLTCGQFLTLTQVSTPANPSTLTCAADSASYNVNDTVNFRAQGGSAPYNWTGGENPSSFTGNPYQPRFAASGNKTVSVLSSDGQNANCSVYINQPSTGGGGSTINNCVNNSCNTTTTTTNTNTNTNTNTYYYYTSSVNPIPANEYRQLSITKMVRAVNGSYQESVSVNSGDTVEFQVVVRNSGNQPINNVRVSDVLPNGLSWISGSLGNGSDNLIGTLYANDSRTLTFQARVNGSAGLSLQNIARATGDSVSSVQDDAWVFINNTGTVAGGNINLTYSKSAWNDSKNQNAQSVNASKEDYITYTLTVANSGNAPATNFVITDDLSHLLPYADMSDNGGGTVSGNVLTYPGLTIPAGGSVTKSFKVRVKYFLADNLSYVMTNTYGNTVTVRINNPAVLGAFIAPKTGANTQVFVFASLITALAVLLRNRKALMQLIFT